MKGPFALFREPLYLGFQKPGEDPPPSGAPPAGGGANQSPQVSGADTRAAAEKQGDASPVASQVRQAAFFEAKSLGLDDNDADKIADRMARIYGGLDPNDPRSANIVSTGQYRQVFEDAVLREVVTNELPRRGIHPKALVDVERYIKESDILSRQSLSTFIQDSNSYFERQDFDKGFGNWVNILDASLAADGTMTSYDRDVFGLTKGLLGDDKEKYWEKYVAWRNDRASVIAENPDSPFASSFADTSLAQYIRDESKNIVLSTMPDDIKRSLTARKIGLSAETTASQLLQGAAKIAEDRAKARAEITSAITRVQSAYKTATADDLDGWTTVYDDLNRRQQQMADDYVNVGALQGLQANQFITQQVNNALSSAFPESAGALSQNDYAASISGVQKAAKAAGAEKAKLDTETKKNATQTQANQAALSANAPITYDDKGNPIVDKARQEQMAAGEGDPFGGLVKLDDIFKQVENGEIMPTQAVQLLQAAANQGLASMRITGDAASTLHRMAGVVAGYDITSAAAQERNPVGFFTTQIRNLQTQMAAEADPLKKVELERQVITAQQNLTGARTRLATPTGQAQQQQIATRQAGEPYDPTGARANAQPFRGQAGIDEAARLQASRNTIQPAMRTNKEGESVPDVLSPEDAEIFRSSGQTGLEEMRVLRRKQAADRAQRERQGTI